MHAAHQLAHRYPDGQLFLDLHGYTRGVPPLSPYDALDSMLRALGTPDDKIPAGLDDRAALFRSQLAGRRVLVLLDNAMAEEQVGALLPGTPGVAVLITSRRRLTGLDNAQVLTLDTLPSVDAISLFRRAVGEGRLATEPLELLAETATLCDRLPLALRIAAGRLRSHPTWRVTHLIERLHDHRHRLEELQAGSRSVTAALDLSYQQLTVDQQCTYRLLGLHPCPDIDTYAAAALSGATVRVAQQMLDHLLEAHLLQEIAPGRYRFHDLVWAHAGAIAARDHLEQTAALTRLLDYYRYTAAQAMDAAHPYDRERRPLVSPAGTPAPEVSKPTVALAWMHTELPNLLAASRHAADAGWAGHALDLSAILHRYLYLSGRYREAQVLHERALEIARTTGEQGSELDVLIRLGQIHRMLGLYDKAITHYEQALNIAHTIGSPTGEIEALIGLGHTNQVQDRYDRAFDEFRQAREIAHGIGNLAGQLNGLIGLAQIHRMQGLYQQAITHYQQALDLARTTGNRNGELNALNGLGHTRQMQNRHEHAIVHYQQALDLARTTGNRNGELYALNGLGQTYLARGHHQEAAECYQQALDIAAAADDPNWQIEAEYGLGRLQLVSGRPQLALDHHRRALDLATYLQQPTDQARAHDGIARIYQALRRPLRARHHWQLALAILTSLGTDNTDDRDVNVHTIRACLAQA